MTLPPGSFFVRLVSKFSTSINFVDFPPHTFTSRGSFLRVSICSISPAINTCNKVLDRTASSPIKIQRDMDHGAK